MGNHTVHSLRVKLEPSVFPYMHVVPVIGFYKKTTAVVIMLVVSI